MEEAARRHPESVAKHFLGFHHSQAGIHGANADVGDRLLSEIYGKPFQAAIQNADLRGIMPCYCSVSGLPIHASKRYLTDLLRTEMGFEGVVVSDYGAVENVFQVQHVGESKADAGLRCMKAGMDVELPMPSCYSEEMRVSFAEGEEDTAVLDRAVLRILEAKFRMGLFEHPYALTGKELIQTAHHHGDDEISKQAAQESLVLLKNNGALPLTGKEKIIAVIGVHFDGRPISSDTADELLDAVIEAWTPAVFGAEAVVNVLTGDYNPSGKLPLTVARNAGQIPIYYNHPNGSAWHQGASIGFQDYVDMPHTPRYFFGHGLSYTTFSYENLELEKKSANPAEDLRISLTVKNTGKVSGTEVVQLYLRDEQASMTRPVKELQGFARVELVPGEERKVVFTVSPSQTAFLDEDLRWKIEKGKVQVQVGASSEDIRLEDAFDISGDLWIEGRERRFFAEVQGVCPETQPQR